MSGCYSFFEDHTVFNHFPSSKSDHYSALGRRTRYKAAGTETFSIPRLQPFFIGFIVSRHRYSKNGADKRTDIAGKYPDGMQASQQRIR